LRHGSRCIRDDTWIYDARGGHPCVASLNDANEKAMAPALYNDERSSIADTCETVRVARSTLYRDNSASR